MSGHVQNIFLEYFQDEKPRAHLVLALRGLPAYSPYILANSFLNVACGSSSSSHFSPLFITDKSCQGECVGGGEIITWHIRTMKPDPLGAKERSSVRNIQLEPLVHGAHESACKWPWRGWHDAKGPIASVWHRRVVNIEGGGGRYSHNCS